MDDTLVYESWKLCYGFSLCVCDHLCVTVCMGVGGGLMTVPVN